MPNEPKSPKWETRRKADSRKQRLDHRAEDPRYPRAQILVSTLTSCPHGTEYGYNEFGCRCIDLGPPAPADPADPDSPLKATGCGPAGVRASANRRRTRRNANADTIPMTALDRINAASALAQLDTGRLRLSPAVP